MQPSYFFTSPDPDYLPKGSRDPLGFQVIWQHQGRKLIPYLSTVSSSLRDFQVLCIARYLYQSKNDTGWPKFFVRFEQLMAYARGVRFPLEGFNGVDKVRNKLNESGKYWISNQPTDEILSSQRAYGIWGKYIRPFLDISFATHPLFEKIYRDKIAAVPEANRILSKVIAGDRFSVDRESLELLFPLFNLRTDERNFLLQKLVRLEEADALQNRLFNYIDTHTLPDQFDLYPFLEGFGDSLRSDEVVLKSILEEHAHTERILSPANTVFRYLQTKPLWTREAIDKDDYITSCNRPVSYDFISTDHQAELLNGLNSAMGSSNWNLVAALEKRNAEVAGWRGGNAWMAITGNLLEVRHSDGALKKEKYDPITDHENSYFLPTFISMYRQLKKG